MNSPIRAFGASTAAAVALLALAACAPNSSGGAMTALTVQSSATDCTVSSGTAPSGTVVFTVTNSGEKATEFYLLAEDGRSVVGELENIAPGAPRDLTIELEPGEYITLCKPGMTGDGIGRAEFTVTESSTGTAPKTTSPPALSRSSW